MPKGYQGKILRVDLSSERIWYESPEPGEPTVSKHEELGLGRGVQNGNGTA